MSTPLSEHGLDAANRRPKRPRRPPPVEQTPAPISERNARVQPPEAAPASPKPRAGVPNAPPPAGKPVRVLANLGFFGTIEQFTERLRHVTDVHEQRFGYRPSPGFALDLARSPLADVGKLFDATPQSDRVARLHSVAQETPKDWFLRRDQTGTLVPRSPFLQRIIDRAAHVTLTPKQQTQIAKANYPTAVQAQQMGLLPLTEVSQPQLEQALDRLDRYVGEGHAQITEHGVTLGEFGKELKAIQSRYPSGVVPPMEGPRISNLKDTAGSVLGTVRTIKDAQTELNGRMGTKLPVNGYFNDDWLKAVSNWMHSADYFRQVAKYQSQSAGFGDDYATFYKAWKAKQDAVNKHGAAKWFIAAQPLHLFAHGGGVGGFAHGVFDELVRPKSLGLSTPLHLLTRTAGLSLDEIGGSIQQGKAYAAAGNAIYEATVNHGFSGATLDEAKAGVRKSLQANPSWLRVFYPQLSAHPKGAIAALDKATNLAGDLILLRKPVFTGERVAAGDILSARRSPYLRASSHWAFTDLQRGRLGRAASSWEGGRGAEKLAHAAEPLVKNGDLSEEQLAHHAAELYAYGRTTLAVGGKPVTIESGELLGSLRTKALPTPGVPGRAWLRSKSAMRDFVDAVDVGLRRSELPTTDNAAGFLSALRSTVAHAAPRSVRSYFDPKLPERVHDFALKHFGDAKLANEWESRLVRFRATDNVVGIQRIERKLQRRYALKYPVGRDFSAEDPFKPMVSTEAPSIFHFPSGGFREVSGPFDIGSQLQNWSRKVGLVLNKLAVLHSRIILTGFPVPGGGLSLAWKHTVGDTLRRAVAEDGFVFGQSGRMKRAATAIDRLAANDPEVSRMLGTYLARAERSETRWLLNKGGSVETADFQTGDRFGKPHHMAAAGGYLRRMLDDPALDAYGRSSESDLSPLRDLILNDRTYRGIWKDARRNAARAEAERLGRRPTREEYVGILPAEEFAQKIWNRYVEVEQAGRAAGSADPLADARQVLQANRGGKVDEALGRHIAENRWDFGVKKGQVEPFTGGFDQYSRWWIEKIMTANKWNRGQLAKRTMYRIFHDLTDAGWDEKAAVQTAMNVGERVTVYHMLDFANRLQVEQDLRWLSYFATKHRLYWKWVIGTVARRPGAAAVIDDTRDLLDDRGNLGFTLFGHKLAIPAARLVWVPGREYSEVSPVALGLYGFATGGLAGGINAAKGTFGNIFTRSDTALQLLGRAAGMEAGKLPSTYGAALNGLDEQTKSRLARAINEYQTHFFHEHGHYASEADVVKHVLWLQGAEESWRANLPLPILWGGLVPKENEGQKLLRRFMAINDPAKRRRFLDENPDLALYFGVYKDPAVYLHNREFWRAYNASRDQFRAEREQIYMQAKQGGMTPKLREQIREVSDRFGDAFNRLLLRDAAESGKLTEEGRHLLSSGKPLSGVAAEQYIAKRGSWGAQILVDPLVDPKAAILGLFPQIPEKELQHGVPGFAIKEARRELKLLRDPGYQQTFDAAGEEAQQEIKTRIRELLQFISDFQSYPADALGKVQRRYQIQHVNPYWSEAEKRYQQIKSLPRDQQDLAYAEFRQWRDGQDKGVTVDGVKFPSPVRMAWAMLDPQTRHERLAKLAGADWSHVTAYEKQLLGREVDRRVTTGWKALAAYKAALLGHVQLPGIKPLPAGQRRIGSDYERLLARYVEKVGDDGKPIPGFYKDYLFAHRPTYQRLQLLAPVKESPHATNWRDVFQAASGYAKYLKDPDISKSAVRDTWRDYVRTTVVPYLREHPRFAAELAMYRTTQGPKSPTRRDAISMATDVAYGLIAP